ncbi:MAG TPA: transketolase [Vitreimonas sp.]|nr:transketolase [Vitreimonas sp.]
MTKPLTLDDLVDKTFAIRKHIIEMLLEAKSGHSAGSLGMTDVFAALYFCVMKHDPTKPNWSERDRLLLSAGHICPALYATLAEVGYFPKSHLKTLRKLGSPLQGHPHLGSLPGIENTSGPLGQGLSQACGVALAFKMDNLKNNVFAILSDGEHQEGQTWEAYMLGAKYRLSNLTVLIDRNNIQIDGNTEDIMPLEPLRAKLEAFGWHVQEIDGHNLEAIIDACHQAQAVAHAPSAIICHTIPGKGVEFMEGDFKWHGAPPTAAQAKEALRELRTLKGKIRYQ